ncbi:hypothetical protein LTR74_014204 [Friedmanniomyces endolithicus]|nr:hypothetical protein LTR74_014204 [Friedmanniomyces endolithicus]
MRSLMLSERRASNLYCAGPNAVGSTKASPPLPRRWAQVKHGTLPPSSSARREVLPNSSGRGKKRAALMADIRLHDIHYTSTTTTHQQATQDAAYTPRAVPRPGYGYDPRRMDVPLGRHGHGYHHTSMVHFAYADTAHDASQPVDDLLHYNMDDHTQTNRADDAHLDDQTQANRPDDARVDQLEQALHLKGPDPAGHTLDKLHHEDVDGPHEKHSSAPQYAHPARPVDHLHLVEALRLHDHTASLHLLAPRLLDDKLLDQALDDGGAPALLHPLVGLHHDQRLAHGTLHPMVAVVFRNHLPQLVDALHEHRLCHRELLAHQEQDDGHGHANGYQAFRHLAG